MCPGCGCLVKENIIQKHNTAVKVLMILSCVSASLGALLFIFLGLWWGVAIYGFIAIVDFIMLFLFLDAVKEKKIVGLAFKIITLLFVNAIAGTLLLCEN